jgi:hypothetical protein
VAALGRRAVHFASAAEKMADCHTVTDFGRGAVNSLAEEDIRVKAAGREELVKGPVHRADFAGKEEPEQSLEKNFEAG